MRSFGSRRSLPLLLVAAVAAPISLAAQAGDWQLHPVHRGSSASSDWVSLTIYAGDMSNTSLDVPLARLRGLTSALLEGADTNLAFSIPSEFISAWTRFAEVIMSILSIGIEESPMPGRSGAITVNFSASNGMIGRHIRDVSAKPCNRITAGP